MPKSYIFQAVALIVTVSGPLACHPKKSQNSNSSSATNSLLQQDLEPSHQRTTWEGWGTSLSWWGKALGTTPYESTYADLIFTEKSTPIHNKNLPGLGFNIVRYNVGGGGQDGDVSEIKEQRPKDFPWYKDIDGYWVNWNSKDPNSSSYNWERDPEQRSMLQAAVSRGVTQVEFFANAPMWWMMDSKSSAGGKLQKWNRRDFALYLANVIAQAKSRWNVNVTSIEPFNEPESGFWDYPKLQEGCNISQGEQKEILGLLREELDKQNLDPKITASDENSMDQGLRTYQDFQKSKIKVNGTQRRVSDLVEKVNVHSYKGLEAWRNNNTRHDFKKAVGDKRLWISEFGDSEGGGAELAQTLMEDINHLQPQAWVYWQVIEPSSAWGLMNANYGQGVDDKNRGETSWIYGKYYVMAHFSRYIKAGMKIIEQNDPWSIVAYDEGRRILNIVTVNRDGGNRRLDWNLEAFGVQNQQQVELVTTALNATRLWETSSIQLAGKRLQLETANESITSISIKL